MTATKPSPTVAGGGVLTPETFAALTAVLHLERRKPGFTRSVRTGDVVALEDPVDRRMLTVQKHMLDPKILREINSEDNAIVAYLETRCAPCSMLARGMWAFALGVVDEVSSELDGYKARRAALVGILAREKYAAEKDAAQDRLGKHFNEADYPTVAALEASFGVRARWLSLNVPSALAAASDEIYQRETARFRAELVDASAEIRDGRREAFAALVEHVAMVLGTDKDGKPNRFQDTTITKLQDFLSVFEATDLTGDGELAALAGKARTVLNGTPADRVRNETATRTRVLGAMTEIKTALRKMDVTPPKRAKFRSDAEV